MPTQKQVIYCRLLKAGLLHLRAVCAGGGWGTGEQVSRMREAFRVGNEIANFLHRVPGSVLEPEYVDNDVSFINHAFPVHLKRLGDRLDAETAALMLAFYDGVPESLRPELTRHPGEDLRRLASGAVPGP